MSNRNELRSITRGAYDIKKLRIQTGQPEDTDDNGTPVLTPPLENADPGPATGGTNEN